MAAIDKIIREEHEFISIFSGENASIIPEQNKSYAYFNGSSNKIYNYYIIMTKLIGMTLEKYISIYSKRNKIGLKNSV